MILASCLVLAGGSVAGGLALEQARSQAEPTITNMFGDEEPAGFSARMQQAADGGPTLVTCDPDEGTALICTEVADEDAVDLQKQGETVYGRTVRGIPWGAQVDGDAIKLHSASLVCEEPADPSMRCLPVDEVAPTIQQGQELFVYYAKQVVTFTDDGTPVLHIGEPTVQVQVVTD